jgi:hypothetical protein
MANKSNIMISIDREILDKLNELPNKSGFINNLLCEHFSTIKPLKEKLEEKKDLIKEVKLEIKEIEKEVEKIEEIEEITQEQREKDAEIYEKSDERWLKLKEIERNSLKNYDISKENFEETLDEFMEMLKNHQVVNLLEYVQLMGLKKKEKREEQTNDK